MLLEKNYYVSMMARCDFYITEKIIQCLYIDLISICRLDIINIKLGCGVYGLGLFDFV